MGLGFKIQGVAVEVDEERTASLYEVIEDWCQCDGCTNARMGRVGAASAEQLAILRGLGLDILYPFRTSYAFRRPRQPVRHMRTNSCWLAYGSVIGGDATPRLDLDGSSWIRVDSQRERAAIDVESLGFTSQMDLSGLIYIVTSNVVPRLYDEVCEFRSAYVREGCPNCGTRWRETGYLKRRSLIPEWRGLPELKQVLREGKCRVYVEFCSRCGRIEHQVVDDKPPFRRKNTLLRDESRRLLRASRL